MQPFFFDYSTKSIPTPSKFQYRKVLVNKVESFIGRLRWALFFIQNPTANKSKETFGFPTNNSPPALPELKPFEDDLMTMVRGIQFRPINNQFQKKLSDDIRKINNTDDVIVSADKTENKYYMPIDDYNKLLKENITKDYKQSTFDKIRMTNKEAAVHAKKLDIEDRVEKFIEADAYITVKDHKTSFPNRIECRLLNPAKSNLGRVTSKMLKEAISSIKKKTGLNLWTNSGEVTDWFSGIDKSEFHFFLKFDVVNFYPTISEKLLDDAIQWGSSFYDFSTTQIDLIKHARKAFLFHDENIWEKTKNPDFDVTMGSYDGAECCEIVGLFILNKLVMLLGDKQVGLYRDDGLAVLRHSGPEAERIKKQVQTLFKSLDLKITIETHISEVEFLDLWLDLNTNSYKPFRKNNNIPSYINADSNHPTTIKKHLPNMISSRLSSLSSSKEIFMKEKPFYDTALKKAGYSDGIQFVEKQSQSRKKRTRHRKVIWFNPPYNQNVKTNVAGRFLGLIDKHFGKSHLKKYFNRQTIKVSYSTTANMEKIISGHNLKVIEKFKTLKDQQQPLRTCNCRNGIDSCPLSGNCLTKSTIYQAKVIGQSKTEKYIGLASNTFKERYSNHQKSFKNEKYESSTHLSKCVWNLKRQNQVYNIEWSILLNTPAYHPARKKCDLCLSEKVLILTSDDILNGRTEILQKCRHRSKYLLSSVN